MQVEVKFKKVHVDAILPKRNHGNREMNEYEAKWLADENERFEHDRPEQFAAGYRIGFPFEMGADGMPTNLIQGTGDTGYDVFSVVNTVIPAHGSEIVDIGVELAYIVPGYWFRVEPRSGMGFKGGMQPHLGVIDNGYKGNLAIKLYNFSNIDYAITKGNRIAQIVFYPIVEPLISWSDDEYASGRGANGMGSSGK
jgi:dUTP pyrophosphatase